MDTESDSAGNGIRAERMTFTHELRVSVPEVMFEDLSEVADRYMMPVATMVRTILLRTIKAVRNGEEPF